MAWVTPKIDYSVNYIPTPTDLNRIEGDLKYLREEDKTINGTTTFTSMVSVAPDTNISCFFGRGKLGSASGGGSDIFYLSHYDLFNSTDFALRQFGSDGQTDINSKSSIKMRIGGTADIAQFSLGGISCFASLLSNSLQARTSVPLSFKDSTGAELVTMSASTMDINTNLNVDGAISTSTLKVGTSGSIITYIGWT